VGFAGGVILPPAATDWLATAEPPAELKLTVKLLFPPLLPGSGSGFEPVPITFNMKGLSFIVPSIVTCKTIITTVVVAGLVTLPKVSIIDGLPETQVN